MESSTSTEQKATAELMEALQPKKDALESVGIRIGNADDLDWGLKCREKVKLLIEEYKKVANNHSFESEFKLLMEIFDAFEEGKKPNYDAYYLSAKATYAYVSLKEHELNFLNLTTEDLIHKYLNEKPVIYQLAQLHANRIVTYANPYEY